MVVRVEGGLVEPNYTMTHTRQIKTRGGGQKCGVQGGIDYFH